MNLFGMQMRTTQEIIAIVLEFFNKYSLSILGSIITLSIGWILAKFLGKLVKKLLLKRNADVTITKFIVDIVILLVMVFAVLLALGNFGITIAPFVAGLSVIGFGTSFAFQGPLSNYAAGATLIFTKPFKVGDIIEMGDKIGQVEDMTLARTIIITLDGTRIVIPNKKIIGEIIHNYSQLKKLDINVGVGYNSDVDKALSIINEVVSGEKRVSQRPQPKVGISEFAESSINVYARLWCRQADYWDVMFAVHKNIYDGFKKQSITIPFPQRDIHVYNKV